MIHLNHKCKKKTKNLTDFIITIIAVQSDLLCL